MTRLGLEIPTVAKALRLKQEQLKANYNILEVGIAGWCLRAFAQKRLLG